MKRVMTSMAALAIGAGAAHAGGVERSTQSVGILFEQGNYGEVSFGAFNPDVSGSYPLNSSNSGDMAPGYGTVSLGYKQQLNDQWDLAVIFDQPVGAKVNYPAGTGNPAVDYPIAGSNASIKSSAITALVRYKMPNNVSVYGGLRSESVKGNVNLPALGYSMSTSDETDFGYVVGAAWEKPEIAARVALTYNSKIEHEFSVTENGSPSAPFTTTVPESVNLEFQTGIAKDTLVMGSVRWVHWKQFDITPLGYLGATGDSLVSYKDNTITYNLGVGRRFTDQWSGAIMFGYEKHQGGTVGNLGPTDGFKSVSLAASYQATDNIKITGGLRYVDIGDAKTTLPPGVETDFSGNDGWGAGLRVGINF